MSKNILLAAMLAALADEEAHTEPVYRPLMTQGGGAAAVVAPPASAPLFSSAEIGSVNAQTLAVTFDQDISASNYATGVTIKVNGETQTITSATRQANHAIVYYVIPDGFFVNTDTVTWEYTGGNIVAEDDATALGTVTAQTVTNNEEIMRAIVTLTDAQIKGLGDGTGITIVAAPGANKGIAVFLAILKASITTGYVGLSADAAVVLADDGIANVFHTSPFLLDDGLETAGNKIAILPPASKNGITPSTWLDNSLALPSDSLTNYANKPVVITDANLDGAYTGGNAANTMTVTVFYAVVDV